jgi:hypothetical protein
VTSDGIFATALLDGAPISPLQLRGWRQIRALNMSKAQTSEVGQLKSSDRLGDMAQGIAPNIAKLVCIGQFPDAHAVQNYKYNPSDHFFSPILGYRA